MRVSRVSITWANHSGAWHLSEGVRLEVSDLGVPGYKQRQRQRQQIDDRGF